ncbi:MAG: outer membrane beta-barrel protein [bacterium]|nr:outer membrane beta-barrel protein [bacterium]
MKKITKITLALLSSFIVTQAYSQGMYANLGLGYGMSAGGTISPYDNSSVSNGSTTTYNYKSVSGGGSFGKGMQIGGTFGYMFNKNVGAELGISYLMGGKITSKDVYTGTNSSSTDEYTYKGKMLRFAPGIRLTVGEGKIKPYMRTGVVIGVGTKLTETYHRTSVNGSNTNIRDEETAYTGGISFGFACGLGMVYAINDNLGIFAELGIITQSWAPKKGEVTSSTLNGVDQLSGMTTSQKETEYLKSYSEVSPGSDPGSPNKSQQFKMPFSSAGINVGVHYTFGAQ